MKKHILIFIIVILNFSCVYSQKSEINHSQIKEDLYQMLNDISQYYVYQKDKKIDLNCLLEYYESQIPNIKTEEETVLFFEYLLNEFYDNHLTLGTNRKSSFRLFAPIYTTIENGKPIISTKSSCTAISAPLVLATIHKNWVLFLSAIFNICNTS